MRRWNNVIRILSAIGSFLFYSGCRTYRCPVMPDECFTPQPDEPAVVKFMTYNILKFDTEEKWQQRKAGVIETIERADPDVLAVQELRTPQEVDFERVFTDYHHISASNQDPEERSFSNAIFIRKDRFRFLDYGHFWFSSTPETPSNQWHNKIPRLCLWSRIEDLRTARTFYFYNVHLDHRNGKARIRSVHLLMDRIRNREHRDPYVVAGDFNVNSGNVVIRCMQAGPDSRRPDCREVRLVDSFATPWGEQISADTFNKLPKSLLLERIDYIFVPSFVHVLAGQIIPDRGASDHNPVTATLRFPPGTLSPSTP